MKNICAWCKCETAQPDGTDDDKLITHGICEECKRIIIESLPRVERYIED